MPEGYATVPGGGMFNTNLVCETCGALVWDANLHTAWHNSLDK